MTKTNTNTNTFTYDNDIAWDCPISEVALMLEAFNATMSIMQAEGPGGGNPWVKFHFTNQTDRDAFETFYESDQYAETIAE